MKSKPSIESDDQTKHYSSLHTNMRQERAQKKQAPILRCCMLAKYITSSAYIPEFCSCSRILQVDPGGVYSDSAILAESKISYGAINGVTFQIARSVFLMRGVVSEVLW